MGGRWNPFGFNLFCFILFSILILEIPRCYSLDPEGLALLAFRAGVDSDPFGAFANWNLNDTCPCSWFGVHCVNTRVEILDLNGLSLKGVLAPELAKLIYLKSLILHNNNFYGTIPKEIAGLTMLEKLDLRDNDLYGSIPTDIAGMQSLKSLLLCENNFEGIIPPEIQQLNLPSKLQCDENLTVTTGVGCVNRKFGHCIWESSLKQLSKADSLISPIKVKLAYYLKALLPMYRLNILYSHVSLGSHAFVRRSLLEYPSSNLAAKSRINGPIIILSTYRSSGSFPAIPNAKKIDPLPKKHNGSFWKYFFICSGVALFPSVVLFCMCRSRGVRAIGPWKTGLSGQLQKAFITGVPKLNRRELELACEGFSNIISTLDDCTIYKGTLSSGVEIAVASIDVLYFKDWSKRAEVSYRKKIDTLSRINHKNFVNLVGFCEEDEPFDRMMVFEYAPNGTLFDHLHVKGFEHLNWNSRMKIIMGVAYCLQYMHHDLNPPISHPNLNSISIYLTDDYAAKIGEISFSGETLYRLKSSDEDEFDHLELPPYSDPETNIYSFGILLLEIISGKLSYTEQQGSIVSWAGEYLRDGSTNCMIDPALESFVNRELDVMCEVIKDCIQQEIQHRPTMKEIIRKLREVIHISPESATPRLSPVWWAELEVLSGETT